MLNKDNTALLNVIGVACPDLLSVLRHFFALLNDKKRFIVIFADAPEAQDRIALMCETNDWEAATDDVCALLPESSKNRFVLQHQERIIG